jgi:hypothetical protein
VLRSSVNWRWFTKKDAQIRFARYAFSVSQILREKFSSPEESRLWAQLIAFAPFVFQAAKSLRNFGVLELLCQCAEGATFAEIQKRTGLSEYALGVLLDAGESSALLYQEGDRYLVAPAGEHIVGDTLTRVNMNFTADVCYEGLAELEASLRNGHPEGLRAFGGWRTIYEGLTKLPPQALDSWLAFDHYFSSDAFPKAIPIVLRHAPKKLLDVGGNTGKFAVACAAYDPRISVTMLDHPGQLEIAGRLINEKGFGQRIDRVPIDLLDHSQAFPKGHDVIWMSQFLDCFGKEDILELFQRAREAMGPDTRFFIMEPFLDRQRYEAGRFCLSMTSLYFSCLANGNSRMYRASEFHELLAKAGLKVEREFNQVRLSQSVFECKRA